MNKICTDVKQSKKLLSLGLSPETADMYYTGHRGILDPKVTEYSKFPDVRHEYISFDHLDLFYPCWSLSALMDLMPPIAYNYPVLQRSADHQYHYGETYNKWFISYVDLNIHGAHRPYRTAFYENPIDAAYSMIIFLIEQGYIKTEKK